MAEIFNYPDDLLLKPKDPRRPYDPEVRFMKNQHLGQLKLFSNELEFLLSYVCDDQMASRKKIVLYIGAGPGHHLVYLTKMFPSIEWHLFDDHFDKRLRDIKNVYIEERYFLDEDTEIYRRYTEKPDVDFYFISDIRNLAFDSKQWSPGEEAKIVEDMNLQRGWVESLTPKFSMLKFRLPHPDPEVLEIIGSDKIEYLDGTIYKQPWAKGKSTEARLVVDGSAIRRRKYDLKQHEQQMFYHNAVVRQKEYVFPMCELFVGLHVSRNLKINTRYDCAYIITLLVQYFGRTSPDLPRDKIRQRIAKILEFLSNQSR